MSVLTHRVPGDTCHEDRNGSNFLVSGEVRELCWNSTSTVFRTVEIVEHLNDEQYGYGGGVARWRGNFSETATASSEEMGSKAIFLIGSYAAIIHQRGESRV